MTQESRADLARRRAELVEQLTTPLGTEDRVRVQGELSILNARIKALNTTEAARLKALADRRRVAGLAEAKANTARSRANAGLTAETEDDEDDDPGQTAAIDAWVADLLRHHGLTAYASAAAGFNFEAPPKWSAIIAALRAAIHAAARGQELPLRWNGLCAAGKHGLDHEGQFCDLCAAEEKPAAKKAKKRP